MSEAEARMKYTEEKYLDFLVNNTPGVIYACQYAGESSFKPIYCTPNIVSMMGYTPDDFYDIENLWADNIHPEDVETVFGSYEKLFRNNKLLHRYRWRHRDGHYIWIRDELSLTRTDGGDPDQVVGVWVNVDEQVAIEQELDSYRHNLEKLVEEKTEELQQAQDKLIQSERLAVLGQLAGTVSHELRNPLATIALSLDLIEDMARGKLDDIGEFLQLAGKNIERCDRIVSELLEFSTGRDPYIEKIDLNSWLQETLDELNWPDNIDRILNQGPDRSILIDTALMHRVVNNIVNNAIQAHGEVEKSSKYIRVTSGLEGNLLQITVEDNGPGMSETSLEHVFDPLYSTKIFGVGLGMPIVKNAIESLRGDVSVESLLGRGTTVRIVLPV